MSSGPWTKTPWLGEPVIVAFPSALCAANSFGKPPADGPIQSGSAGRSLDEDALSGSP